MKHKFRSFSDSFSYCILSLFFVFILSFFYLILSLFPDFILSLYFYILFPNALCQTHFSSSISSFSFQTSFSRLLYWIYILSFLLNFYFPFLLGFFFYLYHFFNNVAIFIPLFPCVFFFLAWLKFFYFKNFSAFSFFFSSFRVSIFYTFSFFNSYWDFCFLFLTSFLKVKEGDK